MIHNNLNILMMTRIIALLFLVLFVSGCVSASNKQFDLSQDSLKAGDYNGAFTHAAQSLEIEIDNEKTQAVFPDLSKAAFNYHLSQSKQNEQNNQWDPAVGHYESVVSMQGRIEAIQLRLKSYVALEKKISAKEMARIQAILDLNAPDVAAANRHAKKSAAAAHYKTALSYAKVKQFRDAVSEFNASSQFVSCYQDACLLSKKYKLLADQGDALAYYNLGKGAASRDEYRNASHAFTQALTFIPAFRDAATLAAHYKGLADHQDAAIQYAQGLAEAEVGHYRLAANAFSSAIGFVYDYKDSQQLLNHYTTLANEQDASLHYNRALNHVDQNNFAQAAREFRQANHFVPGFRDALRQARWADRAVPPDVTRIKDMVIHEIQDHGMQPRWYGNYTQKDFVSMKLGHIIVKEGRYKRHKEVWAYPVYIEMSAVVRGHDGANRPLSTSTTEMFTLYRNKHRQWEAEFRH